MLTSKQKRFLKSEAHHLTPIFQVGKAGMNEHIIRHIVDAIEKRELIKISILQNCDEDRNDIAKELADESGSELVQLIGRTIVLYKESKDHKKLELPTR
jgi:RNA-binding protein